jgi:hypothetical protein
VTKISQLSSIGDSLAIGDQFLIRDIDDAGSPNKSVTVSGITRALADGNATAPALAFAADKNTGIYRAGTDSLAVATNGTGRLFIDATGNVGVGTSLPASILHVAAASPEVQIVGSTNAYFSIKGASGGPWTLRSISTAFSLEDNGSERLRITSAGLVGIGTSSPATPLDVVGNIRAVTSATSATTVRIGNTGNNVFLGVESSTGGSNITGSTAYAGTITSNGPIQFSASNGGSVQATLDASGRLGIGTTSPSAKLEVAGGNIRLDNNQGVEWGGVNNYIYGNESTDFIAVATNGNERARIDSSGRLGIGTSSPSYLIDASGTASSGIRYKSTGLYGGVIADNTNPTGGGFFAALQNGVQKAIFGVVGAFAATTNADTGVLAETGQGIQFFTNGAPLTPKAVITSAGLVGIGTTSPAAKLRSCWWKYPH